MDRDPPEIETDLIDLSATSFRQLRETDQRLLTTSQEAMMEQLEHARANLGTGPPGRVD
ncbi:hypothetical protein GCM10010435_42570 [Winogradskya consettensis]|uniref:Uncharacterized protein n=1 Tax=Winogradskya consettensis TaxID=113560 RepID=A0A919VVF1_9ACTN|nr:hypothetical protein [Actinoplanes consettensis]GIM76630.1 hypothetical protein Aco04nite_51310 [Actinoplanes consettensis]